MISALICSSARFGTRRKNSLFDLFSGRRLNERFSHFRSLFGGCLLDFFLDESFKRIELFPNHVRQRGANGIEFFADELIDTLLDQGARDFRHALPNEGFEERHFL